MKHYTIYNFDKATLAQATKLPPRTVAEQSHRVGMEHAEPLIIAMDCLIRYARAHKARFDSTLGEDYMLGPAWLATASGIRSLLDGNGAVAHEMGRNTDSKDNGAVEGMFWEAMNIAGFTEDDLNK